MNEYGLNKVLNDIAGTEGLEATAAANEAAGTEGLAMVGALNELAGTSGLGLGAVANVLAGTADLAPLEALSQYTGDGGGVLFVVGGQSSDSSKSETSTDGTTWTPAATGTGFWLRRMTFGAGLFVALGVDTVAAVEKIYTSPDGITWTPRFTLPSFNWSDITYANGLFVAVGYAAAVYSSDGISWSSATGAGSKEWSSVTYSPVSGRYLAVASSGGTYRGIYSTDGMTWVSDSTFGTGYMWQCIRQLNGETFAFHLSGGGLRSTNTTSWSSFTLPANVLPSGAAFGNGVYVVVSASETGQTASSTDGTTWTARGNTDCIDVVFGNGKFVAVTQTGEVRTSTDGTTWTAITTTKTQLFGVAVKETT